MPNLAIGLGIGVVYDTPTGVGGATSFRILLENGFVLLDEIGNALRKEQDT